MQHFDPTRYQPLDESQFKLVEFDGFKIFVENDAVGKHVTDALASAKQRNWYLPIAKDTILYAKDKHQSGEIKIFALSGGQVSADANSEIYFHKDGPYEIRLSVVDGHRLQEKLMHEMAHGSLELANPHLQNYSPEAQKFEQKLREAIVSDFATHMQKRDSYVPVQKQAAEMIFNLPHSEGYRIGERSAERICFTLQSLVFSEKAAESVAPNYVKVLKEYVDWDIAQSAKKVSVPQCKPPAGGAIHPNEIHIPSKPAAPKAIPHNPDIIVNGERVLPGMHKGHWAKLPHEALQYIAFFEYAHESHKRYHELAATDPHLAVLLHGIHGGVGMYADTLLWSTIYKAGGVYLAGLLAASSLVARTPEIQASYFEALNELSPSDFNNPTEHESDLYNIYYKNPFGPCHGLTPEAQKRLQSRVLALDHRLLEGAALQTPLHKLGSMVNGVMDPIHEEIHRAVYAATDAALKAGGYEGKAPEPREPHVDPRAGVANIKKALEEINPPKPANSKDILTETLTEPKPTEKPVFSPPRNEIRHQPVNSKIPPRTDSLQHTDAGFKDPKFNFHLTGNGSQFSAVFSITYDLTQLTLTLGLLGLGLGGLFTFHQWKQQKDKFKDRLFKIQTQCDFTNFEFKKEIDLYNRFIETIDKYMTATTDEERSALFIKMTNQFIKVNKCADKMTETFQRLLTDEDAKMNVVMPEPHYAAQLKFLQDGKLKFHGHPRFPRYLNKKLKQQWEQDNAKRLKDLKANPVYQVSRHRPTKEAKAVIKANMPALEQIHAALGGLNPRLIKVIYHHLQNEMDASIQRLDDKSRAFGENRLTQKELDEACALHIQEMTTLKAQSAQISKQLQKIFGDASVTDLSALIEKMTTVLTYAENYQVEVQQWQQPVVQVMGAFKSFEGKKDHQKEQKKDHKKHQEKPVETEQSPDLETNAFNQHVNDVNAKYNELMQSRQEHLRKYTNREITEKDLEKYLDLEHDKIIEFNRLIANVKYHSLANDEHKQTLATMIDALENKETIFLTVANQQLQWLKDIKFENKEIDVNKVSELSKLFEKYINKVNNVSIRLALHLNKANIVRELGQRDLEGAALDHAFANARDFADTSDRAEAMLYCAKLKDAFHQERLAVDLKIAHPDVLKQVEVGKWAYVLQAQLKHHQKLLAGDKSKAIADKLKLSEDDLKKIVGSLIGKMNIVQSQRSRFWLSRLNYTHLAIDVTLKTFARLSESYFKIDPQLLGLVNQAATSYMNLTKGLLSSSMDAAAKDINDVLKKISASASEASLLKDMCKEAGSASFGDSVNNFFKKTNNALLFVKFSTAAIDLLLYRQFNADYLAAPREYPTYDVWLEKMVKKSNYHWSYQLSKRVVTGLSAAQAVNQIYNIFSEGVDPFTLTRRATNAVLTIPYLMPLVQYTSRALSGGEAPTNRLGVTLLCFVENMYSSDWQQLLAFHDETILTGVLETLRRNEYFDLACRFNARIPFLLNITFGARVIYNLYNSIFNESAPRVIHNRMMNLYEKTLALVEEFKHAAKSPHRDAIYKKIALLYCDIKNTTKNFGAEHELRMFIYIDALFKQHLLDDSIESIHYNGDGNGMFRAIANYTDHSPEQLRKLAVTHLQDHKNEYVNFIVGEGKEAYNEYLRKLSKPGTFGDELVLRALTKELKRQILIVLNHM